jgi:hypothetical protein
VLDWTLSSADMARLDGLGGLLKDAMPVPAGARGVCRDCKAPDDQGRPGPTVLGRTADTVRIHESPCHPSAAARCDARSAAPSGEHRSDEAHDAHDEASSCAAAVDPAGRAQQPVEASLEREDAAVDGADAMARVDMGACDHVSVGPGRPQRGVVRRFCWDPTGVC